MVVNEILINTEDEPTLLYPTIVRDSYVAVRVHVHGTGQEDVSGAPQSSEAG
jgi:hypothetical protein